MSDDLVSILKALADENRIRIVAALAAGEVCVCQLIELVDLAPSTVSQHLALLRNAGVINARKEGRWMHYSLPAPDDVSPVVRGAIEFILSNFESNPAARADAKRLRAILRIDPEELCRNQRNGFACCSSVPAPRAAARWRPGGREGSSASEGEGEGEGAGVGASRS